ncbi:MAG: hypothetical protein DMG13_15085 [Acidobacteria bacterium]|nr:MAG: hypothetical protein DMG13_15085 [Acidobacteriota bacterium]
MSRRISSAVLVGFLLILLPILAILQYRWLGEVSAAERQRLESSLRVASGQLADEFTLQLGRLSNAFQLREGFPDDGSALIDRYLEWAETAPYPHLLKGFYLLRTYADKPPELHKVDLQSGEMQTVTVPEELKDLRDRLRPGAPNFPSMKGMLTIMSPISRPEVRFGIQRRNRFFGPPPDVSEAPRPAPPVSMPVEGWTLVELDREVILKEMMPGVVERHFSVQDQSAYRVALVTGNPSQVLYSSEGTWTAEDIAKPDVSINIFGGPFEERGRPRGRGPGPPPRLGAFFQSSVLGQRWVLLVKHRSGSLERAVEQVRQRNMAISFGILLVLGAGLVTVVISSQRARTLARLQVEFAAGVSHELRTPLAVIRSAAHNLRHGIVRDKESVEQYAVMVEDEALRLSDMVDQVLLYSETHPGRKKYALASVDVNESIDRAVQNVSSTMEMEKHQLTMHIDPELPPVKADAAALTQCLQNLLSNALKYGRRGGAAHIEILAKNDAAAREVQLSVRDDGPGIDSVDRRHLFEPFYRGVRVGSNVPGNGLGLHLVQRMMQSQGGRVTFTASPEGGALFTLHIPASE